MSIQFLVLGGGGILGFWGRGADFIFMGARIFLTCPSLFSHAASAISLKTRVFLSVKVPDGHHPRGTALREALRGNP